MASPTESDSQFIERLKNVAGTSNHDILSDEEILRGRILLSNVQDQLRRLSEDATILRIALAPHRRLPKDILLYIFTLLSLDEVVRDRRLIPPASSRLPWSLGQVCRAWRQLSRAMPGVWDKVSFDMSPTEAARTIPRALDILPDFTEVSFDVFDRGRLEWKVFTDLIAPVLSRIDKLRWMITRYDINFWTTLPPRAFARLKSLDLIFIRSEHVDVDSIPSYIEVFGSTPRLEHLRLSSSRLTLLRYDLPWHQLTCLELNNGDYRDCTRPLWSELATRRPFSLGSQLETLKLDLKGGALAHALRIDFPWHRIMTFFVHCSTRKDYLALSQVMPKCTTLANLRLGIAPKELDHLINIVKPLKWLHLRGNILPCLIQSTALWNGLQELELGQVTRRTFCEIVNQCNCLVKLSVKITDSPEEPPKAAPIELPHLRFLFVESGDLNVFPLISTPTLDILQVKLFARVGYEPITEFLTRSTCHVVNFSCKFQNPDNLESLGTRELLSSLSHSTVFQAQDIPVPDDVLDDIATGALLPCIEKMEIGALSASMFLNMLERRLQMEFTQFGHLRLQEIQCSARTSYPTATESAKLARIEAKYGKNIRSLSLKYIKYR
ncbi:hypothetical protein C0995_006827 [Termitomyces sp. Mi166|nr:hypothetical protein C0995_006827 [Termitomyces sp. Mi166\